MRAAHGDHETGFSNIQLADPLGQGDLMNFPFLPYLLGDPSDFRTKEFFIDLVL